MTTDANAFFREMTLRICGSLELELALERAFEYAAAHVPVDAMAFGFFDPDARAIRILARVGRDESCFIWDARHDELPLPSELAAGDWADIPQDAVVNQPDDAGGPFWLEVFPKLRSHSAVFIGLGTHGNAVGALIASAKGLDRYGPDHVALFESVRDPFGVALSNARQYRELLRVKEQLAENNRALAADIKRATGVQVVGADFGLRDVMEQVRQIALSSSPALLLGETGTGKEVIANAIHMASPRAAGPMISMQCGAVPDTLLGSELFGHEKGAFTGATERTRGRFERADGGTLFLDEIGELSPEAQVKLLRVLQEHRFERVGGTQTVDVDVRVIAATHRDLSEMVRQGQFREDLWYRLNVLPIRIPPLRLRREDIPSLVQYFVERKVSEMNLRHVPSIAGYELERLRAYDWPGNVRELQNIVERALILSRGGRLQFPELDPARPVRPAGPDRTDRGGELVRTMDEAIADHIREVLRRTGGKVRGPGGAAELLQMNPSTLRFRMKKLGIDARGGRAHARPSRLGDG